VRKDFGGGYVGELLEEKEIRKLVIVGEEFIPPVGHEVAFSNLFGVDSDLLAEIPELGVQEKVIIHDSVEDIDAVEMYIFELQIKRSIYRVVEQSISLDIGNADKTVIQ
jgi:hypothetical protein